MLTIHSAKSCIQRAFESISSVEWFGLETLFDPSWIVRLGIRCKWLSIGFLNWQVASLTWPSSHLFSCALGFTARISDSLTEMRQSGLVFAGCLWLALRLTLRQRLCGTLYCMCSLCNLLFVLFQLICFWWRYRERLFRFVGVDTVSLFRFSLWDLADPTYRERSFVGIKVCERV